MHTQVKISVAYGTLQHSFYIFVILLTVALRLHHAGSCTAGTAEQTHVTYTYIDTKRKRQSLDSGTRGTVQLAAKYGVPRLSFAFI